MRTNLYVRQCNIIVCPNKMNFISISITSSIHSTPYLFINKFYFHRIVYLFRFFFFCISLDQFTYVICLKFLNFRFQQVKLLCYKISIYFSKIFLFNKIELLFLLSFCHFQMRVFYFLFLFYVNTQYGTIITSI